MGENMVLVMKGSQYRNNMLHLLQKLEGLPVCYIPIGLQGGAFFNKLQEQNLDVSNFLYTDDKNRGERIISIRSNNSLQELSHGVNAAISRKCEIIVIDSLTLLSRMRGFSSEQVLRFVNHIIGRAHTEGVSIIFSCIEDDVNSEVVRGVLPIVDKFIEYDAEKIKFANNQSKKPVYASVGIMLIGVILVFIFTSKNAITGHFILDPTTTLELPFAMMFILSMILIILGVILTLHHFKLSRRRLLF